MLQRINFYDRPLAMFRWGYILSLIFVFGAPLSVRAMPAIQIVQRWVQVSEAAQEVTSAIMAGQFLATTSQSHVALEAILPFAETHQDQLRAANSVAVLQDHGVLATEEQVQSVTAILGVGPVTSLKQVAKDHGVLFQEDAVNSNVPRVPLFTHRNRLWSNWNTRPSLVERAQLVFRHLALAKHGLLISGMHLSDAGKLIRPENILPDQVSIEWWARRNLDALIRRSERLLVELRVAVANEDLALGEARPLILRVEEAVSEIRNVLPEGMKKFYRPSSRTLSEPHPEGVGGLIPDLIRTGIRYHRERPMRAYCASCYTLRDLARLSENDVFSEEAMNFFSLLAEEEFENGMQSFVGLPKKPFVAMAKLGIASVRKEMFRTKESVAEGRAGYDAVFFEVRHTNNTVSLIYANYSEKELVRIDFMTESGNLVSHAYDHLGDGGRVEFFQIDPQEILDERMKMIDEKIANGELVPVYDAQVPFAFNDLGEIALVDPS